MTNRLAVAPIATPMTAEAASCSGQAPATLDDVLSEVARLRAAVQASAVPEYIDLAGIADLLGSSRRTVERIIKANASFPKAIQVATGSETATQPRWRRAEVITWLNKQRAPA